MDIKLYAQIDTLVKNPFNTHVVVVPLISRSIETNWSGGIATSFTIRLLPKDTATRTSNAQAILLYSLKKQFIAAINGTTYFPKEQYILNEQFSYSYFPDKFWGLGNNTKDGDVESYDFKQYYIYLHLLRAISKTMYVGALFELQKVMSINYEKNGLFDKQDVPGRTPYMVDGLGLSVTFDTRNDAFCPTRGAMVQLYFNNFNKTLGSSYNYTNLTFDARRFIRIYKQQVLALQVYSFSNFGDVPVRSLAALGGNNSMRGYYDGRFRDKHQLVLQAEYRFPIYKRLSAVAFGNMGDVSSTFTGYQFKNMKYSGGGGLRFALNKTEKLNLRFDFGFGKGTNNGYYLQVGEVF